MIKIKIHPLTYFIMLSVLLCGYFNYFLIISFILVIHDLGHIITIKLFKLKIYDIKILPFGSIINAEINYNIESNKLFIISIFGIIMQIIMHYTMNILFNLSIINDISLNIFRFYNKLIIIFNLLPIIPLDGSKILLSILERLLPYKKTLIIENIISLIFIIIFIFNNDLNLNIILITSFLFLKTYETMLNHSYIFHKFLLERFLYSNKNRKIKFIKDIKNIYKSKYNYINNIREEKYLAKLFANN